MSTALGIAAVTAVLKGVLSNAVDEAGLATIVGGDVLVSALPPDRIAINGATDPNQINLFLHQTSYNSGWRNFPLPARDSNGTLIANAPLALNLHYLLSVYGAKDFYPEILLGHAMLAFHEYAVISRPLIEKLLSPAVPPPGFVKELSTSGLAAQVEQITITPQQLDPEQMSRLWSAVQAHYRPTAAYQIGVILVEPARARRAALPVTGRTLTTVPFPYIAIDSVTDAADPAAPIVPNGSILISGKQLRGVDTRVRVGGFEFVPNANDTAPDQIMITFPAALPAGFYAGLKGVQVVHEMPMGVPPTQRSVFQSNMASIVLRPLVTPAVDSVADKLVDSVTYRNGVLKLTCVPTIGRTQSVELLLNEYNPPATRSGRAYTFTAPAHNGITDPAIPDTASVKIPFNMVLPGDYLVRVRVDGAESPLTLTAGVFSAPKVTI